METISETGFSNLNECQPKLLRKKKRKSREKENESKSNDPQINNQIAASFEERKDGTITKDQLQLRTDPILSTNEDSLPNAKKNTSDRKRMRSREKKKKHDALCEEQMLDDAHSNAIDDVGGKRPKKKKMKICESVATVDCLLLHSNRDVKSSCDGNFIGEASGKDLAIKNQQKDEYREVGKDALGPEGVDNVKVKTKKRNKKKISCGEHTTNKEAEVSDTMNEKEPELDGKKFAISLSSSVLSHRVASLEPGGLPRCSCEGQTTRKLVVFDLIGILADIDQGSTDETIADGSVFRRPFVDSFLDFCFEKFVVGVWSSRRFGLNYLTSVVTRHHAKNLLFCFDQNICTTTNFNTQEKSTKPLFLKDLRRVWNRFEICFTCEKRKYDETNTLLVDGLPQTALCNPPHTGIFPFPYLHTDHEDSALGPDGELRKYLERIAGAENVQKFVEENSFGQTAKMEMPKSNNEVSENCDMNAGEGFVGEDMISRTKQRDGKSNAKTTIKPCEDNKIESMDEKKDDVFVSENEKEQEFDGDNKTTRKPCENHKTDSMDEKKDDVSVPENEKEQEVDVEKLEISVSSSFVTPRCSCEGERTKKLVVFDLNGILADITQGYTGKFVPDGKIAYRSVFRRPFVASFLDFCFERFVVGIWSSRRIGLDSMTNLVMGNHVRNLLFCFDQKICTTTNFNTLENSRKPIFLKDLRSVWNRFGTCPTCGKQKYDEANTLLVDDSPHKALCNPPHTGIFPIPYQYKDIDDCALSANGELRRYLERLVEAENVQTFVENNPIGQNAITETHESWEFYSKVIKAHQCIDPSCF